MAAYRRVEVTCRLTVCTPGSALALMLGNKYGRTLPFTLKINSQTSPVGQWFINIPYNDNVTDWLSEKYAAGSLVVKQLQKVLHDTAPRYLGPLDRVADLPCRRALRSARFSRLVVPTFRLSTVGSRSFNVSAPRIWDALSEDVASAPSLSIFRRRLKTYFFQQSYPDVVVH